MESAADEHMKKYLRESEELLRNLFEQKRDNELRNTRNVTALRS